MKRTELIRHLEAHGCYFVREGRRHTVYKNSETGAYSSVPRHKEIKRSLVRKICDDLGIQHPQL
jgi:mRNA interferase HicA